MRRLNQCIRFSIIIGGLYRANRFCEQLVVVGAESMFHRLHWNLCLLLLKSRKSSIGLSGRALYDCRLCYLILILRVRGKLQFLMRFDVAHDLFQILVLVHPISYALSRVMTPHEASEGRLRDIWRLSLRGIIGALSRLLGWCFLLSRCAIGAQGFKRGLRIPRHRSSYSRCIYLRCSEHWRGLLFHYGRVVWELLHWILMLLRRT